MLSALNRPGRAALHLNLALFVGVALALNALIFGLGWDRGLGAAPDAASCLPGWFVGLIWAALLFPLLAGARWSLNAGGRVAFAARRWVTALFAFCASWPLYALALGSVVGGLLGSLAVVVLAFGAVARAWAASKRAALLIVPVGLWTLFSAGVVVDGLGWFRADTGLKNLYELMLFRLATF